ncbi:MAG TPA: nucleotidyltransferase family protein [Phycisphaerae bacterium]|nr:nucleotidyltransferase family protein [Phycisphaerae bacterium]
MPDHDGRSSSAVVAVYAVIPAAGRSRRMGSAKQLLPYGDRTVLETVIETLLAAPINGLAVVTHTAVANELDLPEDPRFLTVINDDAESQMLDSIRMGVDALRQALTPPDDSGVLVCPGDMPLIDVATVTSCIAAFFDHPDAIVVASHGGKRGHPIIVPLSMLPELATITDGGLAELLTRHAESVHRVDCPTPGVTQDLNTPEDYGGLAQP